MTTRATQQKRIKAAEGRAAAAQAKIEQARDVIGQQEKARDKAIAESEWLKKMPVDDEPANGEATAEPAA